MSLPLLTANEARRMLRYDPQTGELFWKQPNSRRIKIGDKAGTVNNGGYIRVRINHTRYMAHRVVWLMNYGCWPKHYIDHINGRTDDNRLKNLRDVEHRVNHQNRKRHRNGNLVGAYRQKSSKLWIGQIKVKGETVYLGCFESEKEAHDAYIKALELLL